MKRTLILCCLLSACGTPQERCISSVTRDLRVVDRLIAETDANLRRGYGLQDVTVFHDVWTLCPGFPSGSIAGEPAPAPVPQMCWDSQPVTYQKPVAIDLAAENAKLSGLLTKRKELAAAAAPMIAQCQVQYPE